MEYGTENGEGEGQRRVAKARPEPRAAQSAA